MPVFHYIQKLSVLVISSDLTNILLQKIVSTDGKAKKRGD